MCMPYTWVVEKLRSMRSGKKATSDRHQPSYQQPQQPKRTIIHLNTPPQQETPNSSRSGMLTLKMNGNTEPAAQDQKLHTPARSIDLERNAAFTHDGAASPKALTPKSGRQHKRGISQ